MKLTSLISNVRACFSLALLICFASQAFAQDEPNYSLWPQRPAELEKARLLISKGEKTEAIKLLQPLATQDTIIGKESRDIIGSLRIQQILDPKSASIQKYTVRRGDSWVRMIKRMNCSQALAMQLNGLMDVPSLKPGDTYLYQKLDIRIVINTLDKELRLYEGDDFVCAYPILAMKDTGKRNFETKLKAEQCSATIYQKHYASTDKTLLLAAGGYIIEKHTGGSLHTPGFYLSRQHCNEIAMLVRPGASVYIIREKNSSTTPPSVTTQTPTPQS